jgi:hypothetical protein
MNSSVATRIAADIQPNEKHIPPALNNNNNNNNSNLAAHQHR